LPVVSFDCPYGPANIIKEGETGFLIANRDKTAFADKVCSLIESPSLRYKMGKAAVQSSLLFSAENIMPQWLALFEKLVEEHRA
jgi:glycosyltransferase involved in cell wall biosynthesis